MTINEKLERFRECVEVQQIVGIINKGFTLELHRKNFECRVIIGQKYAKVDVGTSGRYMVDMATEEIFGIKGYGVIHRGHRYGTLDTIHEWDWSDYRAVPKDQLQPA